MSRVCRKGRCWMRFISGSVVLFHLIVVVLCLLLFTGFVLVACSVPPCNLGLDLRASTSKSHPCPVHKQTVNNHLFLSRQIKENCQQNSCSLKNNNGNNLRFIMRPSHKNYQIHITCFIMHRMKEKDRETRLVTRPVPKPQYKGVRLSRQQRTGCYLLHRPIPAGIGNAFIFL